MTPHVLLVDDSLSVRMDLQHALSAAGFQVTACENGATARKALRTGTFALLILDVRLPDANGIEIAQEARAYPPTAKAPIIMLSAEAEVQHRIRGLTAGASEYIGKPYGAQYVVKRARQLTDMRGAHAGSNASSGPLRILLVDDSPTFLNALADRLRVEGHDVILAKSGSEALSFLAVQAVDGVVLDVFMPGISGLETCRRIKSTPAWADIPVMMLTGREDSVAKATGLRAGVDDYVVKSPDVNHMTTRLSELFRRRRVERGAARTGMTSAPKAPESPRIATALDRGGPASKAPETPRESVRIASIAEKSVSSRGPDSPRDSNRPPAFGDRAMTRGPDSSRDPLRPTSNPDVAFALARGPESTRELSRESAREAAQESSSSPLFLQVLSTCGLPVFIARKSLKRAFERAGVDVASLTPEGVSKALSEVRQTLSVFLPPPETERHVAAIAALARPVGKASS